MHGMGLLAIRWGIIARKGSTAAFAAAAFD
jgi:hypothetical protein